MTSFIAMCIIVGALFGLALFLFVIYFKSKNEMLYTDRKSCIIWGITCLIFILILVNEFSNQYTQCSNPNCNEWANSAYCQKCGWKVNTTVDCPTCEKKFDAAKLPDFCPDCGTKVKE